MCDLSSYCCRLTVSGGAFQVSIQERKDAGVAVLHGLQRNVGGPVFEGVQGGVGQRNVAQTQLQGRLDTPKIKAVFIHPYLIQKNTIKQMKESHLQSRTVGLDVQSYDVVVQREDKGQAGRQQLVFVLLHSHTHLQRDTRHVHLLHIHFLWNAAFKFATFPGNILKTCYLFSEL